MQYLAKCDLIVYDLHFGNPKDVETALKALSKPVREDDEEERPAETVLILISSLLAWDNTPKKMQEIIPVEEARQIAAEKAAEEARIAAEEERAANAENEEVKDKISEKPKSEESDHESVEDSPNALSGMDGSMDGEGSVKE